jgi:hypothetical protein
MSRLLESFRAFHAAVGENDKRSAGAPDEAEAMAALAVAFIDLMQARWARLRALLAGGGMPGFDAMREVTPLVAALKQSILAVESCRDYYREARCPEPPALDGAAARAATMLAEAQGLLDLMRRANEPPPGVDLERLAEQARDARARGETVEAKDVVARLQAGPA